MTDLGDDGPAVPLWAAVDQQAMGETREPAPRWRRALLAAGPWPWVALFWLPLLWLWRRRPASRRRGAFYLLFALSAGLLVVCGVLSARVAQRWLRPPAAVRGDVQLRPRAPAPGKRVLYAWGASTMHGDVFHQALSIPRVAAWCLRDRVGGAPLEVQNLAKPGSSVVGEPGGVPERLRVIFDDPARYRPAAVLLYIGHNEFSNARELAWRTRSPAAELRWVAAGYEAGLRAWATRARDAGVPLFLALPVANVEGHAPPGPRHGPDARDLAGYEARLDDAESALRRGDAAAALAHAQAASALSPQHAWAHFVAGVALRQLGRDADARVALRVAWLRDHHRQRTPPALHAVARRLCAEGLAHCVDATAALRAEFPWLDDRAFIDLHHPVARGHALIGEAFARAVARVLGEPAPRPLPPPGTWPRALDPASVTADRYLQTAGWYLALAAELRHGYPRAQRDALRRAVRNERALHAGLHALPQGQAADLRRRLAVEDLLVAALSRDRPRTQRLWARMQADHDWANLGHPVRALWVRQIVAQVLGVPALEPPRR